MKRPIQVGDRVSGEWVDTSGVKKIRGVYMEQMPSGFAAVSTKEGTFLVAPSSMRRLVKRKDTRRRWWVNVYPNDVTTHGSPGGAESAAESDRISCVEVVEVRKKKNG